MKNYVLYKVVDKGFKGKIKVKKFYNPPKTEFSIIDFGEIDNLTKIKKRVKKHIFFPLEQVFCKIIEVYIRSKTRKYLQIKKLNNQEIKQISLSLKLN